MKQSGKVYLVGAGPGNLEYLTVQAQQLLLQAEVLVYDALVDEQLLTLVPPNCLLLEVGKRGGSASTPQTEINHLLVDYCQRGRRVIRLKSGDPFIFGRSTAEIEALKNAGCDFEVVPGLSSALAAPLLANIPLTDPVLSRCFAVMSAHEPDELHWEALTQIETLVILMGARQLPEILHQLERHGRSPQTPIAVIRWAGHPEQQIWTGTLGTILQKTAYQHLSPAIIVIGEVVGLRPYLQAPTPSQPMPQSPSYSSNQPVMAECIPSAFLPLAGKTILVTRSAGQSSQFTQLLQDQGATVIEMPALEITPPSSWAELDEAIAHLNEFDWLILTSTNGVDYFFERLAHDGKDARALAGVKLAVVGKKTAQSLKQYGLQPDFIPPDFVADALVEMFPEGDRLPGLKILFPRVETGGREVLVKEFTDKGAVVTEVPAYQSSCAQAIAPEVLQALQQGTVNIITFASSKTVQCVCQMLGIGGQRAGNRDQGSGIGDAPTEALHERGLEQSTPLPPRTSAPLSLHHSSSSSSPSPSPSPLSPPDPTPHPLPPTPFNNVCIASIGPQTSATCQQLIGRVDVEAAEYTLEGLTQAIVQWVKGMEKDKG